MMRRHVMPSIDYTDVELRILPKENDAYPIQVMVASDALYRGGQFVPGEGRDPMQLWADKHLQRIWQQVSSVHPQRRLRLWLEAPELHHLVWEKLEVLDPTLPAGPDMLLSRYIPPSRPTPPPPDDPNLRVLFAVANPVNLDEYGLAPIDNTVWTALRQSIQPPADLLEPLLENACTLENLVRRLQETQSPHVLCFVGHGRFPSGQRSDITEPAIFMADTLNRVRPIRASDFAHAIQTGWSTGSEANLRLVMLISCETSASNAEEVVEREENGEAGALQGFAHALVAAGAPAVLAMQEKISIAAAQEFSTAFFGELLRSGIVDLACTQARRQLKTLNHGDEAHIPTLFMGIRSGELIRPHPLYAALQNMMQSDEFAWIGRPGNGYLEMPVSAVQLENLQNLRQMDALEIDFSAGKDLLQTLVDTLQPPDGGESRPVVLVGRFGSSRTTQMYRLAWRTARLAFACADAATIPVFIDLDHYVETESTNHISALLFRQLARFWPELKEQALAESEQKVHMLLLFDNFDHLDNQRREEFLQQLVSYRASAVGKEHEIVISTTPAALEDLDLTQLEPAYLAVQHLERRAIYRALQNDTAGATGERLLQHLVQNRLLDIAAIPGFLATIWRRAQVGEWPQSRTDCLREVVEEGMRRVPVEQGMRSHAPQVLTALAWTMQRSWRSSIPLDEAFALKKEIRGAREYSLEDFLVALEDANLLLSAGSGTLRFPHHRTQSYFAARAIVQDSQSAEILDDITATLGRLTRLRWWHDTLVFVVGLLADDSPRLYELLGAIVYGVNLVEGEQVFLAARCLLEASANPGLEEKDWKALDALIDPVTDALLWRLDSQNETNPWLRTETATLLGQLTIHKEAVSALVRSIWDQVRVDRSGRKDYEYSMVRRAAALAILASDQRADILREVDQQLLDLLTLWEAQDVHGLIHRFEQGDIQVKSVAALALGDLYQLSEHCGSSQSNDKSLIVETFRNAFFDVNTEGAVLWSLTDALIALDGPTLREFVIEPFLQHKSSKVSRRSLHRKCFIYLVGLLRLQDERVHDYLNTTALRQTRDCRLASVAIQSLGRIGHPDDKELLERIAIGDFETTLPGLARYWAAAGKKQSGTSQAQKDQTYLRQRAIDALADLGDEETITILRSAIKGIEPGIDQVDIQRSLNRTVEAIFWRRRWRAAL